MYFHCPRCARDVDGGEISVTMRHEECGTQVRAIAEAFEQREPWLFKVLGVAVLSLLFLAAVVAVFGSMPLAELLLMVRGMQ